MGHVRRLTALIEREDDEQGESSYGALCPEVDIASQGSTIEGARANLVEALTLFFECADASERKQRLRPEVFITQVDIRLA